MQKEIIEKFLKLNKETCPTFHYENPLLDKDVANLLANCIVKLLNSDKYSQKVREFTLKHVRDSCKHEPSGHLCIDDNVTEILQESYADLLKDIYSNTVDTVKALDAFLIRNMKEVHITSVYGPTIKPEILLAMSNLNIGSKDDMHKILLKEVIYWNVDDDRDGQYNNMLKSLWDQDTFSDNKVWLDDLSIKNKSEIERMLLTLYKEMLGTGIIIVDLEDWLMEKDDFKKLLKNCTVSSECFQICCSIMTSLLIMTDFDTEMLKFIEIFITNVKINCKEVYFSLLYPVHLRHIVMLLNIDVSSLIGKEHDSYVESTLKYLNELHNQCESDAIMLLSHFKVWFDFYYNKNISK